jgi:hypothetical protein
MEYWVAGRITQNNSEKEMEEISNRIQEELLVPGLEKQESTEE